MARPGSKLYPPFSLPVHIDQDVQASKVEFLEGGDDMDRPKGINSNTITLVFFGDKPSRDMVPIAFVVYQTSVVGFLIQHVKKVILAFAI